MVGLAAPVPAEPTDEAVEAADFLWQQGQQAMEKGHPDEAILRYRASLAVNPGLVRNYMSLAAAYLEKGDEQTACAHLVQYVEANPAHLVARIHLADLFLRLDRLDESREQYQQCICRAQEEGPKSAAHLLHCHARLMEIATRIEDEYEEHLHRGIGLLLLARQRADLPDEDDSQLPVEGLLCQSAGELTLAHQEKPEEARPVWYLHQVWSELCQTQCARKALRIASDAAPFSYLTPAEQRSLHLAVARREMERSAK
jgi:tetratricopeptide (TPR) repeat protein